jgi:hypothetical protein
MKTFLRALSFALIFPASLLAQTVQNGDIFDKISTIISTMPGNSGDDYQEPTAGNLTDWATLLDQLFAANYAAADAQADALGYDLVQFSDNTTNETYYVLEKLASSDNYWGTYILNPNALRSEVVLMAPHPKFDFNTGKQAIYCFKDIDAGFFMMAGTHRCNNATSSTCSGTTTACGASEPYRISDMAHVVTSVWQLTTEYLFDEFADTYFIQLHGFSMGAGDPYVIMSNGTRQTPSPDPIVAIRDELLIVDPVLTFKIAHIDLDWNELIGFTNTNGRYINSSANTCNSSATMTNGRFVHIEQERTRLRDDATGWQKMATALKETFPLAPLPAELTGFKATLVQDKASLSWTVLSESNLDFFAVEKSTDGHYFHTIGQVAARGHATTAKDYQWWDAPAEGMNYYRLRQVDFDGQTKMSGVVSLMFRSEDGPSLRLHVSEGKIRARLNGNYAGNVQIRLYDSLGRQVFSTALMEGENLFPVPMGNVLFYQADDGQRSLGVGLLVAGF